MVAGGGWGKKGIRGAGSVVRYALSFGRHSRQPFGRGLAPLRPLPHPLVATLLVTLTAPAPLRSTGVPSTAPPGLFRGAPLRVCFRRLCYGTDCCLCHRSKLRPSEATSALMSVPDCLCCQHHQQKVIASRHEFDMCPLNSTIPPRASVGSPGFLCPYAYWGELTCRAVLDAGYCSRVTAGTSRCLRIVYVLRYRLTPACGLLPVSLSSRSRSCLVVCNCV